MSSSKTVWIDMTDLSTWKGHFTGIQRVVYNIAKGYHAQEGTKYFTFDAENECFYEFDFASFQQLIDSQNISQISGIDIVDRKHRLVKRAKRVYLKTPASIRKVVTPTRLKKVALKGYRSYLRAKNIQSKIKSLYATDTRKKIDFYSGDTLLILGNSWDRPNLLPKLGQLKQRNDIQIFQVIYDLIPTFLPQAFNEELFKIYTKNMFEIVTISDGLMAISESSKKDVLKFCDEVKANAPPVTVIRLGDDIPGSSHPSAPQGVKSKEEFVLCVGTIEARKNHTLLYYAWKEGLRRGLYMPNLVIVGRPGWYTQDILHTFHTDPEMAGHITILNNVSDDELSWLYTNCTFTVYPSYYEGWGLPIAESLAMGKACLTSNVSSMPEVGGNLCVYHSPYNSGECLQGIIDLMDDKTRRKLEEKIKTSYKPVQWLSTYEQCQNFVSKT
jgi:glycosyltransferase involved in cell wall biosynthesis